MIVLSALLRTHFLQADHESGRSAPWQFLSSLSKRIALPAGWVEILGLLLCS